MTWYRDIQPLTEPWDVGQLDDAHRVQMTFTVLCTKRGSPTFIQELVAILVEAGVGTPMVNIFATSGGEIPAGDGPFLSVQPTQGLGPLGTHNDGAAAYRRPGCTIWVRAKSAYAAQTMAHAAYSALVAVRNQAVSA